MPVDYAKKPTEEEIKELERLRDWGRSLKKRLAELQNDGNSLYEALNELDDRISERRFGYLEGK